MKLTVCDKCGKKIEGKPYKVVIGPVEEGKLVSDKHKDTLKEKDFHEECLAKLLKIPFESGKASKLDAEKIIELKKLGKRTSEIADELGCSSATISNYISKYKANHPGEI